MNEFYCCSYARLAMRIGLVAAIAGVVLFAAASLALAQAQETSVAPAPTFTRDVLPIDDMSFAWMSFFHMAEEDYERRLEERAQPATND